MACSAQHCACCASCDQNSIFQAFELRANQKHGHLHFCLHETTKLAPDLGREALLMRQERAQTGDLLKAGLGLVSGAARLQPAQLRSGSGGSGGSGWRARPARPGAGLRAARLRASSQLCLVPWRPEPRAQPGPEPLAEPFRNARLPTVPGVPVAGLAGLAFRAALACRPGLACPRRGSEQRPERSLDEHRKAEPLLGSCRLVLCSASVCNLGSEARGNSSPYRPFHVLRREGQARLALEAPSFDAARICDLLVRKKLGVSSQRL